MAKTEHQWDLTKIFKTNDAFFKACTVIENRLPTYATIKKKGIKSAKRLAACLEFDFQIARKLEKVSSYAYLHQATALFDPSAHQMVSRVEQLMANAGEASAFIGPAIMAIPKKQMARFLTEPAVLPYVRYLKDLLRNRPHTLSAREERLLAMQGPIASSAANIFRQLNDVDLCFGEIQVDGQKCPITHATFGPLLEHPQRKVRKNAFTKLYQRYEEMSHTLSSAYEESVKRDVVSSRIRNFDTALEQALFSENVPAVVYDNLLETVKSKIGIHHRYLTLHRRLLGLRKLHFYDTYTPIIAKVKWNMSYDNAVQTVIDAVSLLGAPYRRVLSKGLTKARWVDRFEVRGKRSGAFSAGGYDVPPFILLNYKSDSPAGVYTLAHEGGHSMHTWLAARHQSFVDYQYTIFVAEVASTFNEQLLSAHLIAKETNKKKRAYLICRQIDQIRSTFIRQTMFAEFEKITHQQVEQDGGLSLEWIRTTYGDLLRQYFGKEMVIDDPLTMEWARIPHFYRAFYVYKYATGIAAAITLSNQVLYGGQRERNQYLDFLKSGGSDYPLNLLKNAGVDLTSPEPFNQVMEHYEQLIEQLEDLL